MGLAIRSFTPKPVQEPAPKKGGIRRRETKPAIQTEEVVVYGELAAFIDHARNVYSPAVITRANSEKLNYGRLASGILSVDLCLAGGLMRSRGSMLYGNKSAGKSTLALRFVAAAQRAYPNMFAVWIDIEGTFDKVWARMHGVDLNRLYLIEPESGESAVDMADAVARADNVAIIVTDSIAFLTPMKEIAASAEDSLPGIHARLIGNYVRRLNSSLLAERHREHYPVILHLNQFRMAIGVMFGDPRVLPGGRALEFSTTQQIEISNHEHTSAGKKEKGAKPTKKEDKENEEKGVIVLYNEHAIKITKDKSGGRYKEGRFKLIRDEATGLPAGYIDQTRTIINHGFISGILEGAPQSFKFSDSRFGSHGNFRGAPEFTQFLVSDGERERNIVAAIVEHYRQKWGVT